MTIQLFDREKDDMAYIGIKSCGCVVAACVDMSRNKKDTAKFVKNCINEGLIIERISVEETRKRLKQCKC